MLERVDGALVGSVSAQPAGESAALEDLAAAVDLRADTLLSPLSCEERELRQPRVGHGLG